VSFTRMHFLLRALDRALRLASHANGQSPGLQYISERLRLPPDIAGVTLLAFASGAPDIFTQIAAIDGGASIRP